MHPSGARKKRLAHAIFSKDGQNLNRPDVTKSTNVKPNIKKAVSKPCLKRPIQKMLAGRLTPCKKELIEKSIAYNGKINPSILR